MSEESARAARPAVLSCPWLPPPAGRVDGPHDRPPHARVRARRRPRAPHPALRHPYRRLAAPRRRRATRVVVLVRRRIVDRRLLTVGSRVRARATRVRLHRARSHSGHLLRDLFAASFVRRACGYVGRVIGRRVPPAPLASRRALRAARSCLFMARVAPDNQETQRHVDEEGGAGRAQRSSARLLAYSSPTGRDRPRRRAVGSSRCGVPTRPGVSHAGQHPQSCATAPSSLVSRLPSPVPRTSTPLPAIAHPAWQKT